MCALSAQPSVKPPVIGAYGDSRGNIEIVTGVPGSFVLSDSGLTNATSFAFSSSGGFVKTPTELLVLDSSNEVTARFDAPAGPALFAFDPQGSPALAYYAGSLFHLANGGLQVVNWTGDAISIAMVSADLAAILVRSERELWTVTVSLSDGSVINQARLNDASLPALLLAGGDVLFTWHGNLMVRNAQGVQREIAAPFKPASFAPMGNGWVAVRELGGRLFGLRILPDTLELYQLPEVTQ